MEHRIFKIYYILLSFVFLTCITNCNKREWEDTISDKITTAPASEVTSHSAMLGGNVSSESGSTIEEKGICYSTSENPTTSVNKTVMGEGTGSFSGTVTGLTSNTLYYVSAYVINNERTSYGPQINFTTMELQLPSATTNSAENIDGTSSTLNGIVNANGQSTIVTFEYGTTTSYGSTVTATQSPVSGSTNTIVSADISELSLNTIYHYRVKAVSPAGAANGEDFTFTTLNLQPPLAITNEADDITGISAILKGVVNAHGQNTTVTFEYGTTNSYGNIGIADQSPIWGDSVTNVSALVSGLSENTPYYFRIKAVNAIGTSYGEQLSFTTKSDLRATVLTLDPINVTTSSADFGGEVIDEGGSPVTERGIYLSSSLTDTIDKLRPIGWGGGLGTFFNRWYLTPDRVFYIKAYAINSYGIIYGSEIQFTCPVDAVASVQTKLPTDITSNSATLGGYIINFSESVHPVTERGICYNTLPDPTIANTKVAMGSGVGEYFDTVDSLVANTRYYVNAYVINRFGLSYGKEWVFTTKE